MHWLGFLAVVGVFLLFLIPRLTAASPGEAVDLIRGGAVVVDVRTVEEHREQSIPGTVNFPLAQLEEHVRNAGWNKDQAILVFCRSGARSSSAASQLRQLGYTNVHNLGSFQNAGKAMAAAKAEPKDK